MNPTCPLCGAELLEVVDADPLTAPWLCTADARGWWPTELTPAAREAFRPGLRDFGVDEPGQLVQLATRDLAGVDPDVPTYPPTPPVLPLAD